MSQALIVIDVQNDYFAGGAFSLWNADAALDATEKAIRAASAKGMLVVLVQHVAKAPPGAAPKNHASPMRLRRSASRACSSGVKPSPKSAAS